MDVITKKILGQPNPSVGGTDTVMGFSKLIHNQLGQDDPISADRTSVMNYLKLLEDSGSNPAPYTPGIRSIGLDVGATNNNLTIANNTMTPTNTPFAGYLIKSLTRLNLDRITFPKIYKPANTKCQVDILGVMTRSNTAVAGSSTTIRLDASASAVDDYYNGSTIVLTSGSGVGQSRIITDYIGSTKTAIVAPWTTIPATGTGFAVLPTIQSDIQPGFDFSTIDYTVYPTVNVLCSLERLTGATASPSMGVPIVTSINDNELQLQQPILSSNATTSYITALSATGHIKLQSIQSQQTNTNAPAIVRITIDGVVVWNDVTLGYTGAGTSTIFNTPIELEAKSSILIEHKSLLANVSYLRIFILK